jgi:hypothetical protein
MFAFNRSAFAVLVPLAMLLAVALFSSRSGDTRAQSQAMQDAAAQDHAVAANLPSR